MLSGEGTAEQKYQVGVDIGNLAFDLLLAGGAAFLTKGVKTLGKLDIKPKKPKVENKRINHDYYGGEFIDDGLRTVDQPFTISAAKGGSLVKIGTVEGDVMMFSSKIGTETVEGITNFAIKDGKLYLNQLHLQGSSAGSVGREALWNMAKDLGNQYNVKEVIIQGGKRTTGKYKGTVPSPITIKVD